MQYQFTIQTTTHKAVRQGRMKRFVRENVTLSVAIDIEGKMCELHYGYKHWTTKHNEGAFSATPYQDYEIHHTIPPKEGDVWFYRGRTFTVGKKSGFCIYTAPLLENGIQVATIRWSDYYLD